MQDRVIKTVNQVGNGQNAVKYGNKLEFLNRPKANFDWGNEDIDIDGMAKEKKLHPNIPSEIQQCL